MASSKALALREQFGTPEQQRETATFGMWIFLATEVMFFGGLFAGYAAYRMYYTDAFLEGSREMTLVIGTVNTAILLTSSLTMSLAIHSHLAGKAESDILASRDYCFDWDGIPRPEIQRVFYPLSGA